MKYSIHVPVEQYGFIQVDDIPSREEAIIEYKCLSSEYKDGTGMPRNEFNEILEMVILGKSIANDPGIIDGMSAVQKFVLNETKKLYKRLKDKSDN